MWNRCLQLLRCYLVTHLGPRLKQGWQRPERDQRETGEKQSDGIGFGFV